jgi:hypothetical protein
MPGLRSPHAGLPDFVDPSKTTRPRGTRVQRASAGRTSCSNAGSIPPRRSMMMRLLVGSVTPLLLPMPMMVAAATATTTVSSSSPSDSRALAARRSLLLSLLLLLGCYSCESSRLRTCWMGVGSAVGLPEKVRPIRSRATFRSGHAGHGRRSEDGERKKLSEGHSFVCLSSVFHYCPAISHHNEQLDGFFTMHAWRAPCLTPTGVRTVDQPTERRQSQQ